MFLGHISWMYLSEPVPCPFRWLQRQQNWATFWGSGQSPLVEFWFIWLVMLNLAPH